MKFARMLYLLTATALLAQVALGNPSATPIEPSDFSPDAITVGFDFYPDGSPVPASIWGGPFVFLTGEYEPWGVVFSTPDPEFPPIVTDPVFSAAGGSPDQEPVSEPNYLSAHTLDTTEGITATFVDPQTGLPATTTSVGAYFIDVERAGATLTAYDAAGAVVGVILLPVTGHAGIAFSGLTYAGGIGSVTYGHTTTLDGVVLDDFMYEPVTPLVLAVQIDIKPGSDSNCFNPNGHGVLPVAIHGSDQLDVADIDASSLLLDGLEVRVRSNRGPLCSFKHVNGDMYLDLVCPFEDDPTSWVGGGATAALSGYLFDGTPIYGTDSICIVP